MASAAMVATLRFFLGRLMGFGLRDVVLQLGREARHGKATARQAEEPYQQQRNQAASAERHDRSIAVYKASALGLAITAA